MPDTATVRGYRADEITRTARQVRLLRDDTVHRPDRAWHDQADGWTYRTRCGEILKARYGAMLTTRDATCRDCSDPHRGARSLAELLEA